MSNNSLAKTLNISAVTTPSASPSKQSLAPVGTRDEELLTDYARTRDELYEILDKQKLAIEEMQLIAADTGEARAYEVLSKLYTSQTATTKELLETQKRIADLENRMIEKVDQSKNVNIFFNGTTTDLRELILKNTK